MSPICVFLTAFRSVVPHLIVQEPQTTRAGACSLVPPSCGGKMLLYTRRVRALLPLHCPAADYVEDGKGCSLFYSFDIDKCVDIIFLPAISCALGRCSGRVPFVAETPSVGRKLMCVGIHPMARR
jgi:hypothetical protein